AALAAARCSGDHAARLALTPRRTFSRLRDTHSLWLSLAHDLHTPLTPSALRESALNSAKGLTSPHRPHAFSPSASLARRRAVRSGTCSGSPYRRHFSKCDEHQPRALIERRHPWTEHIYTPLFT